MENNNIIDKQTYDKIIDGLNIKIKELEDSRNYWMGEATRSKKRLEAFKDMVKSVAVLID